jgi:hypothetical protein
MQPDTMSLPANVAAIDRALDRLRQPTTVHDRLAILQEFIEFWHGPIRPEDGMTDAEMTSQPLPLPLRWWYRFAGKRSEIMSGQNILFVGPWRWIGLMFFAGGGAFMDVHENGVVNGTKGNSVSIGAKTPEPLQFLKPLVNDRWEHVRL